VRLGQASRVANAKDTPGDKTSEADQTTSSYVADGPGWGVRGEFKESGLPGRHEVELAEFGPLV
jgi:hypothetical protein